MTTYQPVPTGVTGDSISADYWNTYIRDNFATFWKYSVKGDLTYLSATGVVSVLSKPSAVSVLTMDNTGIPSWKLSKNLSGHLNSKGTSDFAPTQTFLQGVAWADITGATTTFTTTTTTTIVVYAVVMGYNNSTLYQAPIYVRAVAISTGDPSTTYQYNAAEPTPRNSGLLNIYYATGVAAGSITVKLQSQSTADSTIISQGRLTAFAYAE